MPRRLRARRSRISSSNLAALDLDLSLDERDRLDAVSRIELGFPNDFGADRLAYGDTRELIDDHRRGAARGLMTATTRPEENSR